MSTGGLALLLHPKNQPHTFPGLLTIGKIFYIAELVFFAAISCAITHRFLRRPFLVKASLTHPSESLFFATCFLALASVIGGMHLYGGPVCGPWLVTAFRVCFWIYFGVTFLVACSSYYLLFSSPALKINDMTPAWDLPIFPFMLSGTLASIGAGAMPLASQTVTMIVAGLTAQGLGLLVSVMMYVMYVHRMIEWGFPSPKTRPAMFIAVGPPAFTALAIIGMADAWPTDTTYFGEDGQATANTMKLLAAMVAVFIWCLAFWFFCIAVIAIVLVAKELTFHLNWWALVFPNVGFTIATIKIGSVFSSTVVGWVGSIMTVGISGTYLFVLVMCVRAVLARQILSEGKDEDTYFREEKPKERRH
ncbi:hypothetical protein ACJQWK_08275 [Exserohilum turcicum]|uniref:C4-dicarboxylate transporter/malic acid transport protein n=1 Tax=Exserohilum turcicum (strain 28A) TaxID=671987 RepID=R0KFV3_EXST2|nr:uncharacterized protein SETTUDRAFT_163072 [Exserohilum turcica Et28A]EOA86982.1 hypothetical protein SETTUDRAFT_163072 [Exserohilum turcica Et28A]